MTVQLLDQAPNDAETVMVAWLSPLRHCSNTRRSGDPLPATVVTHIDGSESVDESWASALVSVHTLCDKSLGYPAARDESDATHRRVLELARYLEDVDLPDGRKATIDFVLVDMQPAWVPYGDDQILRKVGRYQLGLSYADLS